MTKTAAKQATPAAKPTRRLFLLLFIAFSLGNLISVALDSATGNLVTKPFLMLWLGLYAFWRFGRPLTRPDRLILSGLGFSLVGDILLLFQGRDTLFFLGGLASFLCAHFCYILAFAGKMTGPGAVQKRPWLALPLLAYGGIMLVWLWPDLPAAFQAPVALYTLVITIMGIAALNRLGAMPSTAFRLLFGGALFFILSDSTLAVAKFMGDTVTLPQAGLIIMITYLLGQWGIVEGWGKDEREAFIR
ncbi:MAG: lysoplasmalogenase [Lewinellaceae bacterium]|nr:lysoplasmalogenase [Lewinellaceae bacterium]